MNKKVFLHIFLICSAAVNVKAGVTQKEEKELPAVVRVVEGKELVTKTAAGKDIEAKLMKVRNSLDREIKAIDESLEKEITDLQGKARLKVDSEYLEKKQSEILRKRKERDVKAEAAQEEFTKAFNRELAKFNGKIKETVSQLAEEEGWDIVKIKETGELIYTSPRVDVSEKVIRAHDKRHKAEKAAEEKAKQQASVKSEA